VHIGNTLKSGHYVYCYKNTNGKWLVLEDDKHVYEADTSLLEQGYIYLYG
jgi:uncharacterized UBP type Zn finger protein